MIAILVAALYGVFDEVGVRLTADEECDVVVKQLPLDNTRDSYLTLRVSGKEHSDDYALLKDDWSNKRE